MCKMYILENFILNLQEFLINNKQCGHSIIRKHNKKLDELGDISFPLNISNWNSLIDTTNVDSKISSILNYRHPGIDKDSVVDDLVTLSCDWKIQIKQVKFINNDAHIFLNKSSALFNSIISFVLELGNTYGSNEIIENNVNISTFDDISKINLSQLDLTNLRLKLLKDVSKNLIKFSMSKSASVVSNVYLVLNPINDKQTTILCGPVLNEKGIKSTLMAQELYQKRSADMRMMAQHKYGIQIKSNASWENYFKILGIGAVMIEMLSNKPQKSIKITPYDLQTANKGASFIFYNCARLSALFKEFDKRVLLKEYPDLPDSANIDFSLLKHPEEWELLYVYIIQFPIVIKNCIKDVENGIVNPQHLISFLSNLSSVFSIYYRRVRILTSPKDHMFPVIHARIYLLKALQCVFHNALGLLNIEPIREM